MIREWLRLTRVRLAILNGAAFAAVALVAASALWVVFGRVEYGAVDASLAAQAQAVLGSIEDQNGSVRLDANAPLPTESSEGIAVAVVVLGNGQRVLDSNNEVPARDLAASAARDGSGAFVDATIRGQQYRVVSRPLTFQDGSRGAIVLGRPVGEVRSTLLRTALLLLAAVAGLSMISAALGYWLAGRALRPVRIMAATARDISEHDLHRRISLDLPAQDELASLAATFNSMLARLESAFAGLRSFTADAAHELRAPLALVRNEAEVVLRRRRSGPEYEASVRAVLAEAERLSRTVDHLLLLARADAGTLTATSETIDLPALVEDTAERWRGRAREQGTELRVTVPDARGLDGRFRGDPDLLIRAIDNLLDNALRYTRPGGLVAVELSSQPDGWLLVVSDTGPGVPAELVPHLFDRFARGDPARGRDSGGAGLGLALARAIAEAHGGSIRLVGADRPGAAGGATFGLRLPVNATLWPAGVE